MRPGAVMKLVGNSCKEVVSAKISLNKRYILQFFDTAVWLAVTKQASLFAASVWLWSRRTSSRASRP